MADDKDTIIEKLDHISNQLSLSKIAGLKVKPEAQEASITELRRIADTLERLLKISEMSL